MLPEPLKDRIDRAALDLFAEQGVDGTPVPAIAVRAGVAVGTLYRHYASKDELAGRLFNENYARLGQRLEEAQAREGGTMAKLAQMIRSICRFCDEDWSLARFLLLEQHVRLKRFDAPANPVDVMVGVLTQGCRSGELACRDPLLAATCIIGTLIQAVTFKAYGRLSGPLSAMADELVGVSLRAVGASGEAA